MDDPRKDLERMARAGYLAAHGAPLTDEWDEWETAKPQKKVRIQAALRELVKIHGITKDHVFKDFTTIALFVDTVLAIVEEEI